MSLVAGRNIADFKSVSGSCLIAVHSSINQAIPDSTPTKVVWDVEDADPDGVFATSRWTPTTSGYAIGVIALSMAASMIDGKFLALSLYKNGAQIRGIIIEVGPSGTGPNVTLPFFVVMNGTTDYLEVFLEQNNGAPLDVLANSIATNWTGKILT